MTGGFGHRVGIASTVVVALVASTLVFFAVQAQGEIVRKADLNDGGIWVTNSDSARFGRVNKPAGQLDAGVSVNVMSGSGLDIFQDGAAVVGLSKATNQLLPIDPSAATLNDAQAVTVAASGRAIGTKVYVPANVDLRGGTIATVDPANGKVRAEHVDSRSGVDTLEMLQPQAKPLATIGAGAVVAVGEDGSVYAASGASGTVAVIRSDGRGGFQKALTVNGGFSSKVIDLTVIGTRWVVYEATTNLVYADGLAKPVTASDGASVTAGQPAYATLQQPGPDAESVLVQGASSARLVNLGGGSAGDAGSAGISMPQGTGSSNAGMIINRPVRLGSCAHAAWAGPDKVFYGRNCGQPNGTKVLDLGGLGKGVRADGVQLRVNRGLIVLNDLDSGHLWDLDSKPVKIDNWDSVIPPPVNKNKNDKKDKNLLDNQAATAEPKAEPDELIVRAGRTSTLHVLDNDTDSAGSVLAIGPADVTRTDAADITTHVSADGQTIEVTLPPKPSQRVFRFAYTVNNGTTAATGRATAKVTVKVVDDTVNTKPRLRAGKQALASATYPVVAGGHLSVAVLADWRDGESDPITAESLSPEASVDGGGSLAITAPDKTGPAVVKFRADDGHDGLTEGAVTLAVLGDSDRAVAPRTQPDAIRAVVGKPVQVQPLGNDVPGADPTDPEARMRLASPVRGVGLLTVDTNLGNGVVTITGAAPGTSILTYAAQVGSGVAVGRIRVDILPNPDGNAAPVAAPDTATVRDQLPTISDVLSNDYSPRSDVLVTQRVESNVDWLRASVVQGRWVRVESTEPLNGAPDRRGIVTYTISDGTQSATGQVSVVQKPQPLVPVMPIVQDDLAIVRLGDAVTIPVLDNDIMADGIPLKLDPRGVKVVTGKGQAFASGTVVRYVPDQRPISSDDTAVLEYTAYPTGLAERAVTGRVTVTIKPLPTTAKPNSPPSASSFSASVIAGDTVTLTVPTSGVDPDGDLVTVFGIIGKDGNAVDLLRGRVVGFGASTIQYQAYPRSSGTEVIRYEIRDRFGLSSQGFIRVGVVQPSDPQPPVAVDDEIVAAPGRKVNADVLLNDLVTKGDVVTLEDPATLNDADELKDFKRQSDDTFQVTAPEEGAPKVLTYGITDGLFDPSRATLLVRGQKKFINPPIAVDDTAKALEGGTSALVDVLANDRDLDGDQATLKIASLLGDGATIEGRKVRVLLRDHARTVAYVVEDADGATAMALIYIPTGNNGAPFVMAGKTIKMDKNSTKSIALADYVKDPRGRKLTVSSPDTVSTSPLSALRQSVKAADSIDLTSTNGYGGPGSLMFEVTDAAGPQDKSALTAYVSVPVQIGAAVPVLRCPDFEVTIVADGPSRKVDIPRLCHAWLPQGLDMSSVSFSADWGRSIERVDLNQQGEGGREFSLRAQPGAKDGATGTAIIGAKGTAEKFTVRVRVVGAQPPALRPVLVEGLIAGTSRTINMAQYLNSSLARPRCSITAAALRSGAGVTPSISGCALTLTAATTARGKVGLAIAVSDAPGRTATGQVTVTVRGKPSPPLRPGAVADRVQGGTARVSWLPPSYNGGLPIQGYEVKSSAGSFPCTASPCTVTGLKNGQPYTFEVRAQNAVDWSDYSGASRPVTPDTKPGPVTGLTIAARGDRSLTVAWVAPDNKGSEVLSYNLQSMNLGANPGATVRTVAAGALSSVISGLVNNDAYSFRIQARNGAGWGPYGSVVQGQSAGTPASVSAPSLTPRTPTPATDTAQMNLSWNTTDPNGPPITRYTVFRRLGTGPWTSVATVSAGAQLVAANTIPYDGNTYSYVVTGINGANLESAKVNSASYQSVGIPVTPVPPSVGTPANDTNSVVTFTLGDPRSASYSSVNWRTDTGSGGSWTCSASACPPGGSVTQTITGLSVQASHRLEIQGVNDGGRLSNWSGFSSQFQPYGPVAAPNNGGAFANGDGRTLNFNWSPNAAGGPIAGYEIAGVGPTGATSHAQSYPSYSTSFSIQVRARDSRGNWSGYTTITGTTGPAPPPPPPPPPPPTVTVSKGASAQGRPGCTTAACRFITVTTANLPGPVTCTFNSRDGSTGFFNMTIGPNVTKQSTNYYGFPGGWVTVTCGGIAGTLSPW